MARFMQSLEMPEARQVLMNSMVGPPAINAPQQQGMLVGGNILQGPAAQAYDILDQQAKMHSKRIESTRNRPFTTQRYAWRGENDQAFFVVEGKVEPTVRMTMSLLGAQGIGGCATPFMHMTHGFGEGVEVSEFPNGRVVGYIRRQSFITFQVLDANRTPMLSADMPANSQGQAADITVADITNGSKVAEVRKCLVPVDGCCAGVDLCCCKGEDLCTEPEGVVWVDFGECANPDYKVLLLVFAIFLETQYLDPPNKYDD